MQKESTVTGRGYVLAGAHAIGALATAFLITRQGGQVIEIVVAASTILQGAGAAMAMARTSGRARRGREPANDEQ